MCAVQIEAVERNLEQCQSQLAALKERLSEDGNSLEQRCMGYSLTGQPFFFYITGPRDYMG